MASAHPRMLVAVYDRQMVFWLTLAAIGITGFIIAFLGEFVFGWWDQFGEWLAWITGALSIIAVLGAAGRFQVRAVGEDVRDLKRTAHRIEQNTQAIPRIEANTEAIPRIEASSQRIEDHTSETVTVLREIRDRLPPR